MSAAVSLPSEAKLARQAKLQATGQPWRCNALRTWITNDKCRDMKLAADTPQCRDCSLPLSLKIITGEELKMAKGTCVVCGRENAILYTHRKVCSVCRYTKPVEEKRPEPAPAPVEPVVPVSDEVAGEIIEAVTDGICNLCGRDNFTRCKCDSLDRAEALGLPIPDDGDTPSWDDFDPITQPKATSYSVGVQANSRVTISVDVAQALGWHKGHVVEVRAKGKAALAFRLTSEPYTRHKNHSLTSTAGIDGKGVTCSCGAALRAVEATSGRRLAEITPWGLIVLLDRTVEA